MGKSVLSSHVMKPMFRMHTLRFLCHSYFGHFQYLTFISSVIGFLSLEVLHNFPFIIILWRDTLFYRNVCLMSPKMLVKAHPIKVPLVLCGKLYYYQCI